MAKTADTSTLSPWRFCLGAPITFQDLQEVAELLNLVAGECPHTHISLVTSAAGWGSSGNEIATHNVTFAGGGLDEAFHFWIWVDSDVQSIRVGASCSFGAGEEGDVKFTVGSDDTTLSFTSGDNGTELTDELATGDTGTGWLECTIEIQRTAGSASDNALVSVRVEDMPIAAGDLPDPANE